MIFLVVSPSITCGFTGIMLPCILIMMGEPDEMKMSEAFFSDMSCSSFSMNMGLSGDPCRERTGLVAPQKFVYAGLGASLRVDLLDDHGAVETIPAVVARQVARDHHGARRDAAVAHLAGGAVVDLRGLADVDAHRDHRALADDHALDHLAAGADEAVVLDDGGVGLQGLENAADAHAARQVHVLPDLGARADGRPRVDHR